MIPITGIDHLVLAVPDLAASRAEFESLGFQLTEKAVHDRFGTSNHLIILGDCYIELLAIENPDVADRTSLNIMNQWVPRGGGLAMIALASDDALESHAALVQHGLSATEVMHWSRDANTPDGLKTASFSTFFMREELVPEVASFFCQQHTINYVRHPLWQVHRNGARRLAELSLGTARDMNALVEQLSRFAVTDQSASRVSARIGLHGISYEPSAVPHATISVSSSAAPSSAPLKTIAGVTLNFVRPD
jgi:catechol 2,3-dioxygenase-like lactoylglutathione lyase family enzyme